MYWSKGNLKLHLVPTENKAIYSSALIMSAILFHVQIGPNIAAKENMQNFKDWLPGFSLYDQSISVPTIRSTQG